MIEFYINKGSVNPVLRMELILDGRFDYKKSLINNALQDSTVTFSMSNHETGIKKIIKSPANIRMAETESCEEKYILEYEWKRRDVEREGVYDAFFEITFNGNIFEEGSDYPYGNLIVPIQETLRIVVK